jgi:hypothetical protein
MEAVAQTNYHGNKAFYKITSLNQVRFHAVLTDYFGTDTDVPPKQIDFTHFNRKTTIISYSQRNIAKNVVANLANALMVQLVSGNK